MDNTIYDRGTLHNTKGEPKTIHGRFLRRENFSL